jgi:hypothetical protein
MADANPREAFVGAGLPAKVVNDYACSLVKRVALGFFAAKPALTGDPLRLGVDGFASNSFNLSNG